MKNLLDSDWLRAVQLKSNTSAKSVKAHANGRSIVQWPTTRNIVRPNMLRPFAWNKTMLTLIDTC